jgi:hypothetical protein
LYHDEKYETLKKSCPKRRVGARYFISFYFPIGNEVEEGIRCQARMYVGKNVILLLSLFFAGYLQRKFPRLFGPPACNGKNV